MRDMHFIIIMRIMHFIVTPASYILWFIVNVKSRFCKPNMPVHVQRIIAFYRVKLKTLIMAWVPSDKDSKRNKAANELVKRSSSRSGAAGDSFFVITKSPTIKSINE